MAISVKAVTQAHILVEGPVLQLDSYNRTVARVPLLLALVLGLILLLWQATAVARSVSGGSEQPMVQRRFLTLISMIRLDQPLKPKMCVAFSMARQPSMYATLPALPPLRCEISCASRSFSSSSWIRLASSCPNAHGAEHGAAASSAIGSFSVTAESIAAASPHHRPSTDFARSHLVILGPHTGEVFLAHPLMPRRLRRGRVVPAAACGRRNGPIAYLHIPKAGSVFAPWVWAYACRGLDRGDALTLRGTSESGIVTTNMSWAAHADCPCLYLEDSGGVASVELMAMYHHEPVSSDAQARASAGLSRNPTQLAICAFDYDARMRRRAISRHSKGVLAGRMCA